MFCVSLGASAQSGSDAYEFLSVPVSAHTAALGGRNVSILDDDVTLVFDNPSLLSNVSDKMLTLDYTSYITSSKKLATAFAKTINERASWAIGAQMLSYGEMTETNAAGEETGKFSAKDIDVQGTFAYMLSDYWSGGVSAKVLTSRYADYSSVALGVDLGLNYCDEAKGFSMSLVAQNLGGQVDPLYETNESLPFNLAFGFSKSLSNAPLRLSFTFDDITNRDDLKFIRHLTMGVDILPSRNSWIALGYNFRRAQEMKLADGSHWAGFSLGMGINIKKVKIGAAWGKYHVAASSLVLNASVAL